MFEPALDLHAHTTASDGRRTPQELVRMALEKGLCAVAITDHDTTSGVQSARRAAEGTELFVVPGVELSIDFAGELHILGLFIDEQNVRFCDTMRQLEAGRRARVEKIVGKLNALGVPLAMQDVLAQTHGQSIGRGHVSYAMVERGFVKTTDEAFSRYLEIGRPAYVANKRLRSDEALSLLRETGAVSIWAHPMKTARDQLTLRMLYEDLKRLGLDGVECFHPSAAANESRMLEKWCLADGLLITGGSDWHDKAGGMPLGWSADFYDAKKYDASLAGKVHAHERFLNASVQEGRSGEL